jgi:nucleoside-diphosphate-sugar epimerase
MKVAITGANGFIGRRLARRLAADNRHQVMALTREEWRLGAPLPSKCDDADAVVHLACAVLTAQDRKAAAALDLDGTRLLLAQSRDRRAAGRPRKFIFISSQSARAEAGNDYGRSKWAIEQLLDGDDEFIVRPGLVYDKDGGSVFGVFETLARLPVAPIISQRPCIQPIDVDELATALVRLIEAEKAPRRLELGAVRPLTLAEMIGAVARRHNQRPPFSLPFPAAPLRLACWAADRALSLSPLLLERIDGLIALQPMDTGPSLAALGLTLAPFGEPAP